MGNSEVGHLNLGAGAVVQQDLTRIDEAVADGTLAGNEVLRAALAGAERVHLIGLVSDGGVHSSDEHLRALIAPGRASSASRTLVVHAFTDGRDTLAARRRAATSPQVEGWCAAAGRRRARSGTVVGRYFAMDRDRRWDRAQQALDLLVHGAAEHHAPTAARGRPRPPTRAARPTSSSPPTTVGDEARDPPRRQRPGLQLPPRPDARDHARAGRPVLHRGRPRRRRARRRYTS